MQLIKAIIKCLLLLTLLSHILSCGKKEHSSAPTPLIDSVAQDPSYRLGKWYSITDSGSIPGYNHNTLLDTIWFINDTLAGWTELGGNPYKFLPTYFSGTSYIVYVIADPIHINEIDTVLHECGMIGDTFIVYWPTSNFQVLPEHYLKMNN